MFAKAYLRVVLSVSLFLATSFVFSESEHLEAYRSLGKIMFFSLSHDFGVMRRGEKLNYEFKFKNLGQGPLFIHGVHAACGCTVVNFSPQKSYAPNEEGQIVVTFDTSGFKGKTTKTITVMTSDKDTPSTSLKISAFLEEEIYANPPIVNFGDMPSKDSFVLETIVTSNVEGLTIDSLKYNPDTIVASFAEVRRGVWKVRVGIRKDIPAGFFKESVVVNNSSQSLKNLEIPIRANIIGNLEFSPTYLEFGALSKNKSVLRSIKIDQKINDYDILHSRAELNISGKRVENVERFLAIEINRDPNNPPKNVSIKLTNLSETSGNVHGWLYFDTDDPSQKDVKIDFYAYFRN